MPATPPNRARRKTLALGVAGIAAIATRGTVAAPAPLAPPETPARRWFEAAEAMKRLAESWGDQPYGAVLVAGGAIIGEGPSRVIQRGDPSAHAEREAIRDAQKRLGRTNLAGSVLYSTSRPCPACESAAAEAQVARMIHGERLVDAGPPSPAGPAAPGAPAAIPPTTLPLFAVELRTGARWDHARPAHEQAHFREHSTNLKRLRDQGSIVLGARYSDKGLLVVAGVSSAAVREMMEADPAIQAQVFAFELHDFRVFYPGWVGSPPKRS